MLLKKLLTGLTAELEVTLELAILDEDTELTGQILTEAVLIDDELDETLEELKELEVDDTATVHELEATDDELAGVVKTIK